MASKNVLKDKLQDGELDLSMMQFTDVPCKEIEQFGGKVTTVNLSHNLLSYLPPTFPLLSHIVKLDLSKNQLSQLPDNFGQLRNLKWLDLYANKLQRLPVSFAQLKNLKWLDLKDNSLVPAIQQAAGPCITPNDCATCAKKVVALLQSMESQLQREMQRKMAVEQQASQERAKMEEMERERVRQEKRAAKDRRREEQKQREEGRREEENKNRQKREMISNGSRASANGFVNGHGDNHVTPAPPPPQSWLYTMFMFLMGVSAVGVAVAVSLVWIYSEGNLDSNSVHAAIAGIRMDMEECFEDIGNKTSKAWKTFGKAAKPYVDQGLTSCYKVWKDGGKMMRKAAMYVDKHYGDSFASVWEKMRSAFLMIWEEIRYYLEAGWTWSKPHFHQLGKMMIENGQVAWDWFNQTVRELGF